MVVLAVVVVVLCTAVFILLRDHSQSDEERRARRHRHTQLPASAYDFKYRAATDMSTTTPSPSVLDRIRRLIQGRRRNQEATRMRGFVQAAGDEWDDDMSDLRHNGKDTAYDGTPRDTPFRPPKGSYATTVSESSVHIHDSETRETATPPGLGDATPRSQSPQPMEGYTGSEESAPRRPHPSSRPFSTESAHSVQSMQSMRSLESGTRFIEGL